VNRNIAKAMASYVDNFATLAAVMVFFLSMLAALSGEITGESAS
jgi:hypothetical protein